MTTVLADLTDSAATGARILPVQPAERIQVLDVLRGLALLGMVAVHFDGRASATTGVGEAMQRAVDLLLDGRAAAVFGILFGVGFAIQLRRADAKGERFAARFLRRLFVLFCFGLIAEAGFGYNVFVSYAVWGVLLLVVRRWPTRALVVALIVCASSPTLYGIAMASRERSAIGLAASKAAAEARQDQFRAHWKWYDESQKSPSYVAVVEARARHMPWFYSRPFSFLPTGPFVLFLIGLVGLRLGLFERPGEHVRLIAGLMIFGVASWAAVEWLFPYLWPTRPDSLFLRGLSIGFGILRDTWLSFTYIGAVLLVVARNPAWLRRLAALGWAGRMALTNYMLQIIVLDLVFSNYALGLSISAVMVPVAAALLFVLEAAFSRWWLARFRYGPLEWVWRSLSNLKAQPMRLALAA